MSKKAVLISAGDGSADITGGAYDLGDGQVYSVQLTFSAANTLVGVLTLEGANDGVLVTDALVWTPITGSTQSIATGSASHIYNVTSAQYRYFRPKWVATSGAGTITACSFIKQLIAKEN